MRWFPFAFLSNGVLKVTHGGIELTTLVCESASLTTTPQSSYDQKGLSCSILSRESLLVNRDLCRMKDTV